MTARSLARRVARVLAVALVVAASRIVLGPWPTSVALSLTGLWLLLRAWYRLETRWDRRRRVLVPEVIHPRPIPYRPGPAARHVAFARALAAVAAAYQSECEQEASQR